MTKEENEKLNGALEALFDTKEYRELITIVNELSESPNCHKGDYNNVYSHVLRSIDELAIRTGWIYDKLKGEPKRGKSMIQKIRKVLGYTYP